MSVKAIPDGYYSLTPYLVVKGAAEAIEFYKKAFGAVETVRMPGPDGRGHARRGSDRQFDADAVGRKSGKGFPVAGPRVVARPGRSCSTRTMWMRCSRRQ